MKPIRVLLIDDQALVLAGLSALLRSLPGIELVGAESDAQSALSHIARDAPDVVLSDFRMPGMSGIELTHQLRQRQMSTPVLLLTTFEDPDLFLRVRRAGTQGYLLKDTSPETLLEGIITLYRGGTLFEPKATQSVQAALAGMAGALQDQQTIAPLSARELEILRLMAGGYSNREIASALHPAEGTVNN